MKEAKRSRGHRPAGWERSQRPTSSDHACGEEPPTRHSKSWAWPCIPGWGREAGFWENCFRVALGKSWIPDIAGGAKSLGQCSLGVSLQLPEEKPHPDAMFKGSRIQEFVSLPPTTAMGVTGQRS